MTFGDLAIGAVFFDPRSGDYWRKMTEDSADHLEGEEGVGVFDANEIVEV